MRDGLEEEERVNSVLLRFAKKYDIKVVATNNTFYIEKEDAEAHDALLCIDNNESISTPIGRGRGKRFGFPNDEFYFKTQRSEEHTSELQSRGHLVCRLLLEKKKEKRE